MQDEDEVPADSALRAKPSSKRARTAVEPPDMGDFHGTAQTMGAVAIGGLAGMVESLKQAHLFNDCPQGTFNHITGVKILAKQFEEGKLRNQSKEQIKVRGSPRRCAELLDSCSGN